MRKALTLLAAAAALTACGSGGDEPATTAAPTTSTSSATSTSAAPAQDVVAQGNCLAAELGYAPIGNALDGTAPLEEVVQFVDAIDLESGATTEAGKAAAVALAELAVELGYAKINVMAGAAVDRPALETKYIAAREACRDVSGS